MSDDIDVEVIPRTCEHEGCDRAPALIVSKIEYSGLVMDARFVCAEHEAEARASL